MGLQITATGHRAPPQELPTEDAVRQKQIAAAARSAKKNAALKRFTASLPGNSADNSGGETIPLQGKTREATPQVILSFMRKLQYIVDHESHEVLVKVIDPNTDKVIKILPPEEIQMLNRNKGDYSGFLFDQQV